MPICAAISLNALVLFVILFGFLSHNIYFPVLVKHLIINKRTNNKKKDFYQFLNFYNCLIPKNLSNLSMENEEYPAEYFTSFPWLPYYKNRFIIRFFEFQLYFDNFTHFDAFYYSKPEKINKFQKTLYLNFKFVEKKFFKYFLMLYILKRKKGWNYQTNYRDSTALNSNWKNISTEKFQKTLYIQKKLFSLDDALIKETNGIFWYFKQYKSFVHSVCKIISKRIDQNKFRDRKNGKNF